MGAMAKRQPAMFVMLMAVVALVHSGVYGQISRVTDSVPGPTITSAPQTGSVSNSVLPFFNSETCGFIGDSYYFGCSPGSTCTLQSTSRSPLRYVGCCSDGEPCPIVTTCYPSEEQQAGLNDPNALVCRGSRSRCWTYLWKSGSYATAFDCSSSQGVDTVNWDAPSTSSSSGITLSSILPTTTGDSGNGSTTTPPGNGNGPTTTAGSGPNNPSGGDSVGNPGPLPLSAKIGLGVGAVSVFLLGGVLGWYLCCKKRRTRRRRAPGPIMTAVEEKPVWQT